MLNFIERGSDVLKQDIESNTTNSFDILRILHKLQETKEYLVLWLGIFTLKTTIVVLLLLVL